MSQKWKVFISTVWILFFVTGSCSVFFCHEDSRAAGNFTRAVLMAGSSITRDEQSATERAYPQGVTETAYTLRKPNETGKIMVVVFHKFVENFVATPQNDGAFTTTFKNFSNLLETLYEKGYRLINLHDYLENRIDVPSGCIPMVFTFDDGSAGQFHLVKEGGMLKADRNSAVGVMEAFHTVHPDFGLKGTFYVNLGMETFPGGGTLTQRLSYLIGEGFEIGNHTYTHTNLEKEESRERIIRELGEEQKRMQELVPGYQLESLALPFGQSKPVLDPAIVEGVYEGIHYKNRAIMRIAWDPMDSPVSPQLDPLSFKRVMASCMTPYDGDLAWWLKTFPVEEQYISDGCPDTTAVPLKYLPKVDLRKLAETRLILVP